MPYDFLVDTYETERVKVVSVWSGFSDADLPVRPHPQRSSRPQRARADGAPVRQRRSLVPRHAGHRCGRAALAAAGNPFGVHEALCGRQRKRVIALREKRDPWWEEDTTFFDVRRSRAWVMTRRLNHTSHHRGQLMAMLRMLGHVCTATMDRRLIQGA